nr:hypothetical protein CFP56_72867 [Quercus suber]
MSKEKEKVGGSKQFRWLPPMHTTLLRLLAEEAAKGNKPSNTFRAGSFAFVAKEISAQFGAHRKHAEYLNNKIEMYDELAIVVGKDIATSSFSKSYVDVENEPDNGDNTKFVADNAEEGVVDKGKNAVESSTTGSGISKSRKRGHAPPSKDSVLTDLSDQLKKLLWL